jgi:hypothetical protein
MNWMELHLALLIIVQLLCRIYLFVYSSDQICTTFPFNFVFNLCLLWIFSVCLEQKNVNGNHSEIIIIIVILIVIITASIIVYWF